VENPPDSIEAGQKVRIVGQPGNGGSPQ
jgi:hypothetical protein